MSYLVLNIYYPYFSIHIRREIHNSFATLQALLFLFKKNTSIYFNNLLAVHLGCSILACVAGVRKGKGKGIRARDHARGRREEGNACKEAIVFAIPPTN